MRQLSIQVTVFRKVNNQSTSIEKSRNEKDLWTTPSNDNH